MKKYFIAMLHSQLTGFLPLILNAVLFFICIAMLKLGGASGLAPLIIFLFINFMPALLFEMIFDHLNNN
ncbi:MAG: hypothetical protein SOT46_09100 [Treponema sp.]|nr:hypothetical protein [Spirochaetia bacterium]MDY2840509.1 hypothetical protein [Treponema sp.]MDY5124024.1 hypothetical protein [Treponema sp.]